MQLVDLLTEPIEPVERGLVAVPGGSGTTGPTASWPATSPASQACPRPRSRSYGLDPLPRLRAAAVRGPAIRAPSSSTQPPTETGRPADRN